MAEWGRVGHLSHARHPAVPGAAGPLPAGGLQAYKGLPDMPQPPASMSPRRACHVCLLPCSMIVCSLDMGAAETRECEPGVFGAFSRAVNDVR